MWKRHGIQALWALLSNSYIIGFIEGRIYRGSLKQICTPGLNCYSCPGALGSCPIGSLQAVSGSIKYQFSFYTAGLLFVFGGIWGRWICGYLCPFGLIQELLNKIPAKKIHSFKGDKSLRYLKYAVLLLTLLLPVILVDFTGQGTPYFCQLICPAGTLEAGIPLAISNTGIRNALGVLFAYKFIILMLVVLLSVFIYRPFCKYICPLGAIYGLLNKVSLYQLSIDGRKCSGCGTCGKSCPMKVDPLKKTGSAECIRCGYCRINCPNRAIFIGNKGKALKDSHAKLP